MLIGDAVQVEARRVEVFAAAGLHVGIESAGSILRRPRDQRRQVQVLPVLDGQGIDLALVDDAADIIGGGIDRRHLPGDLDHLRTGPYLQLDVLDQVIVQLQGQPIDGGSREGRRRNRDGVAARSHGGKAVPAIGARRHGALVAAVGVEQNHLRARHNGPGDIRNGSLDICLARLGKYGACVEQDCRNNYSGKDTSAGQVDGHDSSKVRGWA